MKNLSSYILILFSFVLGVAIGYFKFEQNLSSKITECYGTIQNQVSSGHSDIIDVSRNSKYNTLRYYILGKVYVCALKYKYDN